MILSRCLWLLLLAPLAVCAQDPLLARIKSRAVENLRRAPNYTCALSVERFWRAPASRRFTLADKVRLEVALSGERELFAWPGSESFGETSPDQLVPGGTTSNGDFALFVSDIFLHPLTTFTPDGETLLNGTRAIRYGYSVPAGYSVQTASGSANVGYHGSLLVDARTLDLLQLEMAADAIPPALGLSEARDTIRYQRVKVGDSDFLLPVSSEVQATFSSGTTSLNRTQFSGCRQFVGQSAISFGEAGPPAPLPTPPNVTEVVLAPGLTLDLRLEAELDSLTAAIGDPVIARVASDVVSGEKVVVPKGSPVFGRVMKFERKIPAREDSRFSPWYTISMRFLTLELGDRRAGFTARLVDFGPSSILPGRQTMSIDQPLEPLPGLGEFRVWGERVRLPRGFRMRWRTGEAP